ncbi:MAG: hypothetical protein Q3989_11025 [Eubacteriales bacterium]|nr:hypothetical protein [Eubacteriales bacterium]
MAGNKVPEQLWKREEIKKILRYVRKPWLVTLIITGGLVLLGVLVLLISGRLESFIVFFDLRYNSPELIMLAVIVFAVQVGACFYGIVLSLKKYKRPGATGFINPKYNRGNSYSALHEVISSSGKKQ